MSNLVGTFQQDLKGGEGNQKDLYSLRSGSTEYGICFLNIEYSPVAHILEVRPAGIDAEVAEFFSQHSSLTKSLVIDEATNVRLRWLVHKRVLVRL